jgi:hypothetical protein
VSESPTFWLVVVVLAALVAIWLAFQILGFVLKLIIFGGAVLIAIAAYRSWEEARRT